MSKLNAMSVQMGVSVATGDHPPKSQMVDSLIAFSVLDFDPDEPGDYGRQPRVDVDLLIVDGELAGTRDEKWRTWGNLAGQMGAQAAGVTIAARVTSGPGKVKDSSWYGLDFALTPEEIAIVREAVLNAAGGVQAGTDSEPKTTKAAKKDGAKAPF
jgi:hypothetical protein